MLASGRCLRTMLPKLRYRHISLLAVCTVAICLLVISAGCCQINDQPSRSRSIEQTAQYSVVVIVDATRKEGPSQVALSFSRQIDRHELEQSIRRAASDGGWRISALDITNEAVPNDTSLQTTVSFTATGIVDRQRGWLGVEPFIRQFVNEGSIKAVFFAPGLAFTGPRGYSRNDVEVRLRITDGMYQYDARVAAWRQRTPADTAHRTRQKTASTSLWWVGVALFVVAITIGVVAGRALYGRKKQES